MVKCTHKKVPGTRDSENSTKQMKKAFKKTGTNTDTILHGNQGMQYRSSFNRW